MGVMRAGRGGGMRIVAIAPNGAPRRKKPKGAEKSRQLGVHRRSIGRFCEDRAQIHANQAHSHPSDPPRVSLKARDIRIALSDCGHI